MNNVRVIYVNGTATYYNATVNWVSNGFYIINNATNETVAFYNCKNIIGYEYF